MAYSMAVTVNDANEVAAYRINVDNDPLFPKMVADKRLRIESTAVDAEALLPCAAGTCAAHLAPVCSAQGSQSV